MSEEPKEILYTEDQAKAWVMAAGEKAMAFGFKLGLGVGLAVGGIAILVATELYR